MTDRDIIERYYACHRGDLLAFVSSRLGDALLAEDMVQDVFLRLLRGSRPITEVTLPSLVYTIARNLIADHYRRRQYQQAYAAAVSGCQDEHCYTEPAVHAHELTQCIERSLSRLPQPCATVYRLHIYDGMQVSDIAEHLQQPYKTVEYRLGQARREVRHSLQHVV